jgi:restriction system protein
MKPARITFGSILIFISLLCIFGGIFNNTVIAIMFGISLLLISLLIIPIIDLILAKIDVYLSVGPKIFLSITTFLIGPIFFPTESNYLHLFIYILVISLLWFIVIIINYKKYSGLYKINIQNKQVNKTEKKINKIEKDTIYYDLNTITLSVMSKLLTKTKEVREYSLYCDEIPEININEMVIKFIKDSKEIKNIDDFDLLFTVDYYNMIKNIYIRDTENYVRNVIKRLYPNLNSRQKADYYFKLVNIVLETVQPMSKIETINAIAKNPIDEVDFPDSIDESYRDALLYMAEAMSTATIIAKILFVDNLVKNIDTDSEFYKIIKNMAKEIKSNEKILEKSRPIYDEFYKSELGGINDEELYAFAIVNLVNRIKNPKPSKSTIEKLEITDKKIDNIVELEQEIRDWLNRASKKISKEDIFADILEKIKYSIEDGSFDLLLTALSDVKIYKSVYERKVDLNIKESNKERYIKGDFSKEMKELNGKYLLNNIVSGEQFEIYLETLFKDLGYKVKRCGKSGDQGADLILKIDDYVYAVQAKFYSGKLSNTPVQEIAGALKIYNANQGVVVTNSEFTSGAVKLAKANDVILIDGMGLKKLIDYSMDTDHNKDILKEFE